MKRDLKFEVFYGFPVETVWSALTDPKAIAQWLMSNDFQPKVGHKFQFRARPQPGWNGITDCEVLEVEAPRRLAYSWSDTDAKNRTVVRWTLEPQGSGTRLRLEHDGFEGFKEVLVSFILGRGWKSMLHGKFPQAVQDFVDGKLKPQGPDAHCDENDDLAAKVVGRIVS